MDQAVKLPRVSFFEYMAQSSMKLYCGNALKYLGDIFTGHYLLLTPFRYYVDQIAALIEGLLQFYYLKRYGATYSQYFYALRRASASDSSLPVISGSKKVLSFVFELLAPFLRAKLMKYTHLIQKRQESTSKILSSLKQKLSDRKYKTLTWMIKKLYPLIHWAIEICAFVFNTRYLLNDSAQYFKLSHWLCRIIVRRKNKSDYIKEEGGFAAIRQRALNPPSKLRMVIQAFRNYSIFLVFLGVKFAEWYFSSRRGIAANQAGGARDAMKIAQTMKPPFRQVPSAQLGQCPICKHEIANACVLETSGFCFCYKCISEFIKQKQRCPVTGIQTKFEQIRKIYN